MQRDPQPRRTLPLTPAAIRVQNAPKSLHHVLVDPTPEKPVPFGKYELIRRIGAGGMGEVFLARENSDRHSPRACVVKKVLPTLLENRAFVGRFLDEARVVVKLKHPNIARVYAMGESSGEYYLTMEYVQGKTVSRFTKRLRDRKTPMPLGLVLLLGEKVCTGLTYAHDAKDERGEPLHLVHRDLSPANVCISYRGEVKIIDFGAAQSTLKEEQTAPRVVIGNLTYMAPEQAKKQLVDRRADVYSCGVMLWELLAWFALPQKGDPIERWRKAANPVWEAPSRNAPNVPPDVDEIILRALKKDPKERYQSAEQLGESLRKARMRHAPDVSERDLGDLLSRMFQKEKQMEDEVLRELVGSAPPTGTHRIMLVPPTALAFEHTAVLGNATLQDSTDPGEGPPRPELLPSVDVTIDTTPVDSDPRKKAMNVVTQPVKEKPGPPLPDETIPLRMTRNAFGISFHELKEPRIAEPSLIQEIEAISGEEYLTTPYAGGGRFGWLAASVFLGAVGLGFAAIWLWSRFH